MDLEGSTAAGPLDLQRVTAELISEARLIEVRKKGMKPASVFKELFPHLMDLVGRSEKVLRSLEEWATDPESAPNGERFSPAQLEELANLCFLVSAELRGCRDQFDRMSSESGAFSVFAAIEQVETKLLRGLCAVEADLAAILGLSSRSRHVDLCRGPLQIRRLLGKFRRRVTPTSHQRAEQRLRSVAAGLAWLRGQDDFSRIRASDRLLAHELQERIGGWLRSPERTPDEARHILEEVMAFVTLVDQVNQRQEIMEHDRRLVSRLIGDLSDATPHGTVPGRLAQHFYQLLGRDDPLDEMLATGADTAEVLRRLILLQEGLRSAHAAPPTATLPGSDSGRTGGQRVEWPPAA